MRKIFWGFLLLTFSITLNFNQSQQIIVDTMVEVVESAGSSITILPAFIGWLLIFLGVKDLAQREDIFQKILPWLIFLVVFHIIDFLGRLSGVYNQQGFSLFVTIASLVNLFAVYYSEYKIIKGYESLEQIDNADYKSKKLMDYFMINLVCEVLSLVLVFTVVVPFIGIIVILVVSILKLISYYRASETYQQRLY